MMEFATVPHHDTGGCPRANRGSGSEPSELSSTAFRIEEKRYKLYKPDPKAPKHLRRDCTTDFSDVVDFRNVSANSASNLAMIRPVSLGEGENGDDRIPSAALSAVSNPLQCYAFDGTPGLYCFPDALGADEQQRWCKEALTTYAQSTTFPNNIVVLQPSTVTTRYCPAMRWATLGFRYNWTSRTYSPGSYTRFPPRLGERVKELVCAVGRAVEPKERERLCSYEPQTAIVNYYPVGSMMMAHQDVSEVCLEKPLVSLSLGCSCIFLMGSDKREDKPYAFLLRSGDVVVFMGPSRTAFHSVPRILDDCPKPLWDLRRQASTTDPLQEGPPHVSSAEVAVGDAEVGDGDSWTSAMRGLRININVRQVFDESCSSFLWSDS